MPSLIFAPIKKQNKTHKKNTTAEDSICSGANVAATLIGALWTPAMSRTALGGFHLRVISKEQMLSVNQAVGGLVHLYPLVPVFLTISSLYFGLELLFAIVLCQVGQLAA